MKPVNTGDFKIDSDFKINEKPTDIQLELSEIKVAKELKKLSKKLYKLQEMMFANNKYSVLICLQGMDTSGKDSLVREVFRRFNARGINVHSFEQPTTTELQHDYLWRQYLLLPEKGKFAVFNRSHYENVLVSRVHPEYLLNENIPGITTLDDIPSDFWQQSYEQINNFEKHIAQNGTIVLKFYLHISKQEQKHRLLRRLENEKHNWKFTPSDIEEREFWDQYTAYYEEAINNTSKPYAPWYVIPADNKCMARYLVAQTIYDVLKQYDDIKEPLVDEEVLKNISMYREKLRNEE